MGKTTMARLLSSASPEYRPFRKSVSGGGYKHLALQLKLFLLGFRLEVPRISKTDNFARSLKLSMLRGAVIDNQRWVLDQGYLQPTALLEKSKDYKADIFISKFESLGYFPDVAVFFLAPPEFAEKRQLSRGDIDIIKCRSRDLGFATLREHYEQENLMWLELADFLESKGISTVRVYFEEDGKISDLISYVGQVEGRGTAVDDLSSFLLKNWDYQL